MLEEYSFIQTCTFLPPRIHQKWGELHAKDGGKELMTQLGIEVGVNERHFTTRSISGNSFPHGKGIVLPL
jgi:hypothetical protein